MASYNDSMIADYIAKNYPGLPTDNGFVDSINGQSGGDSSKLDQVIRNTPQFQQQQQTQATQKYQQGIDTAVTGLSSQRSNLAGQYSDLLKTVNQQYQPLINQQTATEQASLAARGISPDSQFYQQQVQGALQPTYGQEAGNAQQIGMGSVADYNTLTQAISGIQAGAAGTAAGLPLQYGSLQMAQAANIANIGLAGAQAQQASAGARYVAIPGLGIYDLNSSQLMPNSSSTGLTTNGPTITGVQFGK